MCAQNLLRTALLNEEEHDDEQILMKDMYRVFQKTSLISQIGTAVYKFQALQKHPVYSINKLVQEDHSTTKAALIEVLDSRGTTRRATTIQSIKIYVLNWKPTRGLHFASDLPCTERDFSAAYAMPQ